MKNWLKRKLCIRQFEILRMLAYEVKRFKCNLFAKRHFKTVLTRLHLGCGDRHVDGWLNVDLVGSDFNIDIANGKLPFDDNSFSSIVGQHVIEHLTIEDELVPLLKECNRTLKHGGELWLSTPDMEKLIRSYIEHQNTDMILDRQKRKPEWDLKGMPPQHFMNDIFHQQLEHRNLFDFKLLEWTLQKAGFSNAVHVSEQELLERFPEFPPRNDDYQSLYIKTVK